MTKYYLGIKVINKNIIFIMIMYIEKIQFF